MAKTAEGSTIVDTSLGKVEYIDHGDGPPVLFVHGSPGGCDQGAVMTEFLVARGLPRDLDLPARISRHPTQ